MEIQVKYAGYLQRQLKQVEEFKREENRLLPEDVDYEKVTGLRLEARQKLSEIRPVSIGQAGQNLPPGQNPGFPTWRSAPQTQEHPTLPDA